MGYEQGCVWGASIDINFSFKNSYMIDWRRELPEILASEPFRIGLFFERIAQVIVNHMSASSRKGHGF